MGSLDDGMRLLKRAQTLVPMYAKRNKAPIKMLGGLVVAGLAIELMCVGVSMLLAVLEFYSFMILWSSVQSAIAGFATIIINVLAVAALRAGRKNMLEGAGTVNTLGEAFSATTAGILGAIVGLIALALGSSLTGCCIIPGVLAYIVLCWAPYLIAARGDEIGDGFTNSIQLGQKYWSAAIGLIISAIIFTGIVYVLIGSMASAAIAVLISGAIMNAIADPTGMMIASSLVGGCAVIFKWLCFFIATAGTFSVTGGVMTAMEEDHFGEVVI